MKRSPCSSPEETPVVKTPRGSKYYKQAYRKEWESMPDFKGWLTEVVGHPQRAYCTVCAKSLHAHRLSLLKHTVTLKHNTAALRNFNQTTPAHHYEVGTASTLANSEPSTATISAEPLMVPSLVPFVASGASKASSPMKVTAKQPNPALVKVKVEVAQPAKKVENESPRLTSEATVCEEGNAKATGKVAESDNLEGEINANPEAGSTDRLNDTREDQDSALSVDHPEPVAPPPSVVAKESVVPKAVKPLSEYPISTHVLDTAKGTPVGNLHVSLYKLVDGRWTSVGEGITTPDGRCNSFLKRKDFLPGRYKVHFDVDRYFEIRKQDSLYPFIEIVFDARSSMEHYHIPLLVSPFGYTTYRGS